MKKFLSLFIVMLLSLSMVSCFNSAARKAINEGKSALDEKEYEKALEAFSTAKDENTRNKEALVLYDIIDNYLKAKMSFENKDFEDAKDYLYAIPAEYETYDIKDDIYELRDSIYDRAAEIASIDNLLAEADKFINQKKYYEAIFSIRLIGDKELLESHKVTLEDISKRLDALCDEEDSHVDCIESNEFLE